MLSLNTHLVGTTLTLTRDNGEVVGKITPREQGYRGYWVNMPEGYPFSAMPVVSLDAAQYLVLASVLEHDAIEAYDPADDCC